MQPAQARPILHPMRVVVRRTGLQPDLLRAWERRYGVVSPTRSDGGQRLYTDGDIERLTLLRRAVSHGHSISRLADLEPSELQRMVEDQEGVGKAASGGEVANGDSELARRFVELGLAAISHLDDGELRQVLNRAALNLPTAVFAEQVLARIQREVGEQWHDGALTPGQEHLATAVIRQHLSQLLSIAPASPSARTIIVTTPSGQLHEVGAMLAAVTAKAAGWRVVYLGADLPASEIAAVAAQTGAEALALSLLYPPGDPATTALLEELRSLLSSRVVVMVGGGGALSYRKTLDRIGAVIITSLAELRSQLDSLYPHRAS